MHVAGDAGWTVRRHVLFIMHASRSTSDKKRGKEERHGDVERWAGFIQPGDGCVKGG